MATNSEIIASIAEDLRRSTEAKRAKKLVFYVSQRYWEPDFSIVDSYSFEDLLMSLYQGNPTLDDLKALLYQAVNTLNRKAVYVKIAQYLYKRMSKLYENVEPISNSNANELEPGLLERIAENIEAHPEAARIKKLIFAACKQYWENDSNVIDMYELKELLTELYQLYPTAKRLRKTLDKIVASINRQNFYSFIADTIMGELAYLYKHDVAASEDSQGEKDEETMLIRAQKQSKSVEQGETQDSTEEKGDNVGTEVVQGAVPEGQILPWLRLDSLFDLKQEIMQYTNPLRAKIILFYTIYQIEPMEQHWSVVRTCSLDDLLLKLFQQYGKDVTGIERHLSQTANFQIEGLNAEDNIQTVNTLVESFRRFCKK
ncbi:MAG: hypothetical protein NZ901_04480 [Geminocystis sp.]|nr:hypothetical protein [Geminocystis sp.]HIK37389.1 hypothetical protein [Geminocystis sp. M7585_C2015_104]MCS7147430.1 hypothetical protein [Geminocystis sp.]MCX8079333.1 hypothetical protein [Geminocystis sp.]MDW8117163.1 hypothetical protein [Geminocystis sp.]